MVSAPERNQSEGLITKTSYHTDNNKNLVYDIWGRDADNERFHLEVMDTKPYFFTEEKPDPDDMEPYFNIKREGQTLTGKKLWKVETSYPSQVTEYRKGYTHYEADIPYKNRIRYDNNWKAYIRFPEKERALREKDINPIPEEDHIEPRLCIIDIEVDTSDGFAEADTADAEIPVITIYDSYKDAYLIILNGIYSGEGYMDVVEDHLEGTDYNISGDKVDIVTVPNEEMLFQKLSQYLKCKKPDILTGWNYTHYDHKYIRNRAERIGFNLDLQPYATFDLMKGNDRLTRGTIRNKLDIQGEDILGVKKIDSDPIHEMWDDDKDKLIAYNLLDVALVKWIDDKKGIIGDHLRLGKLAGTDISNTENTSWMVDAYILHRMSGKARLPSKKFVSELEDFEGGYVGEAKTGLFYFIGVLDFKSEYPSVMMEFNISPETFAEEREEGKEYYVSPNGNYYQKEPKGIVPKILEELIELRDGVKEDMKEAKDRGDTAEYERLYESQRMIKYFTNSFYGVLSSEYFRLASSETASDITAFARNHVQWIYKELRNRDYNPLYSDTDSVFFQLEGETYDERMKEMERLREEINETFKEFVAQYEKDHVDHLYIDIDKMYESWLQAGAQKRYAGIYEWKDVDMRDKDFDDKLDVTGFEWTRIDQAEITKEVQYEVLKRILTEEGLSSARKYLNDIRDKVFEGELDCKIGTNGVCRKTLEDYNSSGGFIDAFKWMLNHDYDVGVNDPFVWWWDIKDKPVAVPYHVDEVPSVINIDYERMLERNVMGKVRPLLSQVKEGQFNMEEFLEGKETGNFMDFVEGEDE